MGQAATVRVLDTRGQGGQGGRGGQGGEGGKARLGGEAKLPPQALEAEQSLLGGLLLDNKKWDEVTDTVREEDFYQQNHQLIFQAIGALREGNDAADVVTVTEWLEKKGAIEQVGGFAYLSSLANNTPSVANIATYAKIVRERAILRALISAANEIAEQSYQPKGKSPREVLDRAEKLVFNIAEQDGRGRGGFEGMGDLVKESVNRVEQLYDAKESLTGLSTGFTDLDEMTSGLQKGDLVIVAGRPSMGKTSLALNIAEFAALKKKAAVAVFSLEMPGTQLALRLLSSVSGVSFGEIRSGRLKDESWKRIPSALRLLTKARIFVDSSSSLTPLEVRSRARRLLRQQPDVGLVVVDYIQLMDPGEKAETRATEISGITRALKNLAKELDLPVVALSQLNRGVEQRTNKRPIMSDLRESGAIEQDADLILFIYRDEVYDGDSAQKGIAEVIIGKQRNGPVGTVRLTFRGSLTRFENYTAADGGEYGGAAEYGAG